MKLHCYFDIFHKPTPSFKKFVNLKTIKQDKDQNYPPQKKKEERKNPMY